jgi:hypothetical protein
LTSFFGGLASGCRLIGFHVSDRRLPGALASGRRFLPFARPAALSSGRRTRVRAFYFISSVFEDFSMTNKNRYNLPFFYCSSFLSHYIVFNVQVQLLSLTR